MVMANAYEKYKTQEVTTASPVGLIVMLYNGCIKRLKLARMAIEIEGL
jgi:flagellar protein FliS